VRLKGGDPWLYEKEVEAGSILAREIFEGIDKCIEAIVLVSPNSIGSQWIMSEIGAIRGQHKRVTPILSNVSHDAIKPLSDVTAMDLNQIDIYLRQLRERIEERRRSAI
jgi:hypothetical protein